MTILKAIPEDANDLTVLTLKSKSHWGYSPNQISAWQQDLTISPHYIKTNTVYKLSLHGVLVGYYACIKLDHQSVELDNCFVLPQYIGKGYGRLLMEHCIQEHKKNHIKSITLTADPHAKAFYQRFGFSVIGHIETSIEGRYLPLMSLQLN